MLKPASMRRAEGSSKAVTKVHPINRLASLIAFSLVLAVGSTTAQEPILSFPLDGSLSGTIHGTPARGELGPGATFVAVPDRVGLQATIGNAAIVIPTTHEALPNQGSFLVWFRFTERVGPDESGGIIDLAAGAGLRVRLIRKPNLVQLTLGVAGDDGTTLDGNALLSHLNADTWYHLALCWNVKAQQMELFLNGVLQQDLEPQKVKAPPALGSLSLGGSAVPMMISAPTIYDRLLEQSEILGAAGVSRMPPLSGEGRTVFENGLDLSRYKLELIYQADFRKPLRVAHEWDSSAGGKRMLVPSDAEWVLEGDGTAWTEDGSLYVESSGERNAGHLVLWLKQRFPDDVLIEWEMEPANIDRGLAILFLATRPKEKPASSIFDESLPLRDGLFPRYHSGALDGYHISYWSGGRRTVNLRKNFGFLLATCGDDVVSARGAGSHRLRVLKAGGTIQVEADGQLELQFEDSAPSSSIWTDGYLGLRQMGHTQRMRYGALRVYKLK